jgi:phosphonate transport system permease protein
VTGAGVRARPEPVTRTALPPAPPLSGRGWLTLILLGAVLWSASAVPWSPDLLRPGGAAVAWQVLRGLATPDLAPAVLGSALRAAWQTVVYAVAGLTVALLLAVPLGVLSSGVLLGCAGPRRVAMVGGRVLLGGLRAIHELVWAWLFVAAIGLSPLAAVLALALPYAGILGRIYADLLNDVPPAPLRALRGAGAGAGHVLLYARLPMALPDMLAYTFYRFECGLRSAAILSFVGLGGLGYQIQLALDDLRFGRVATFLLVLIAMIAALDAWSGAVRRRLTA